MANKVVKAFFIAPLIPSTFAATILGIYNGIPQGIPIGIILYSVFSYLFSFSLGIPTYFILKKKWENIKK